MGNCIYFTGGTTGLAGVYPVLIGALVRASRVAAERNNRT